MEMQAIYGNIDHTIGSWTQSQKRTEAQNRRWLVWITVGLGLFCILLAIALILLYIHLTAERDQIRTTNMHITEKCNKALNSLEVNYSRLTDEREELEKNLNYVSAKKLELEVELKTRNSQKDRYFISSEQKGWSYTRQFCRDRGGDLVIINSEEEQRYIYSILKENTWIGLSDTENEGVMKWVDNSTPNVTFWISGEPNNAQGNEDCVQIVSSYPLKNSWNDQPCTEERHWICEN